MYQFTQRPDEVWEGRSFDGLLRGEEFTRNYATDANSYIGITVGGLNATEVTERGGTSWHESRFRYEGISNEDIRYDRNWSSASGNSQYSPPTTTVFVPAAGTVPAYTSTETLNQSASTNFSRSVSRRSQTLEGDTSRRFSYSDRTESGATVANNFGTGEGEDWGEPGPETTNSSGGTTTEGANTAVTSRTYGGSDTSCGESVATLNYETRTYTYTESLAAVTTTSGTFTVPGGTASTWGTATTDVTATFTGTEQLYEDAYAITAQEDFLTRKSVTETLTSHTNSPLEDTVFLMRAGQNFDGEWNLGFMLWTLSQTDTEACSSQRTGVFSDIYASTSGRTLTVPDYRKFYESTVKEGTATTDVHTFTQMSLGAEITRTTTRTNGYYSTHSSDTASYMDPHTHTLSLGEIGTSLHTAVTTSTPGAAAGSTTRFTHVSFLSGYETSGAWAFTTGTTSAQWATTSRSGRHNKWASTHAETLIVSVRMTSTDEVLASSHAVMGAGTATTRVFLGMVAHTVTYVYAQTVVTTSSAFRDPRNVGVTMDTTTESGNVGELSFTTHYGRTRSFVEDHDLTNWTYKRALPVVASTDFNLPPISPEVRFTVPPEGYLGFGGTFTQPNPAIYLTTAQGLGAGAVFHTSWSIALPAEKDFSDGAGVRIYPVNARNTPTLFGDGLVASSLISFPSSLTADLSIAATWSRTAAGEEGEPAVTETRVATHTIGVVSGITGEFRRAEVLTLDQVGSNIGKNGPYAFTGGWGAGENRMAADATVRLGMARVSWTLRDAAASTGGISASSQGTNGSVSFTIAEGKVLLIHCEPLLTLSWAHGDTGDHIVFTTPHQSHAPE